MKNLLIFILLNFSSSSNAQDWLLGNKELKGNVKHYQMTSTFLEDDISWSKTEELWYNENMLQTKSISFEEKTEIHSYVHIYDRVGLKCLIKYNIVNNDTFSISHYEYDSFDRLLTNTYYVRNELYNTQHHIYNSRGLLEKCNVIFADTGDSSFTTYEYNTAGLKTKEIYQSISQWKTTSQWKYNNDGKVIIETYIDGLRPDDSYIKNYTYNDKGKVVLVSKIHPNGQHILTFKNIYNKFQDIESQLYLDENGIPYSTHVFEYTYDSVGNWIKRIRKYSEDYYCEEIRTIEYY